MQDRWATQCRERALRLAVESFGEALHVVKTDTLLKRAAEIEAFLWPAAAASRPHHPCSREECTTPSGKTACHTCGEAWPCTASERKS